MSGKLSKSLINHLLRLNGLLKRPESNRDKQHRISIHGPHKSSNAHKYFESCLFQAAPNPFVSHIDFCLLDTEKNSDTNHANGVILNK